MKRIISVITAITVAAASFGFSASAAVAKGDVNKDGSVTSTDALEILKYVVKEKSTIDKTVADVNGDNKVNTADALEVLRIVTSKSEKWVWPVPYASSYVSSNFGYRNDPFTGARKYHSGTDITMGDAYGKNIVAVKSGRVDFAGSDSTGYGNYIIIVHDDEYTSLYGHCSKLLVTKDQYVQAGQVIALIGQTGSATGPHVHVEITHYGERVNPLDYISK